MASKMAEPKSKRRKHPLKGGAATMQPTKDGGHRWTVYFDGQTLTTMTSGSSVATILEASSKYAPALKRLAEK
jgi:hypothetical protein